MKKTLFLIFSAAIVIFSVICLVSSPLINKVTISGVYNSLGWGYLNCKKESDDYKKEKDTTSLTGDAKDKYLKPYKHALNLCNRKKAVYGLEHASLILDIILGFLCLILGLLHYFDVGKPFEKVTGIIGLATGIIQFILTLVYVCYSGYIFTNDGPESNSYLKADKDGVIATWDESKRKYKCDFYDKDDEYAIYAKYNDLGKKIYNYDKDIYQAEDTNKITYCHFNYLTLTVVGEPTIIFDFDDECISGEGYIPGILSSTYLDCDKLYVNFPNKVENKYLYDRWVTTIIFACFIIACDIGLAIFGFLLFKSDGSGI
jgi:hypothetical protein